MYYVSFDALGISSSIAEVSERDTHAKRRFRSRGLGMFILALNECPLKRQWAKSGGEKMYCRINHVVEDSP